MSKEIDKTVKPIKAFDDFVFKVSIIWKFDELLLQMFLSGSLLNFLDDEEESKENSMFHAHYTKQSTFTEQQIMQGYKNLTDLFISYHCSIGRAFEKSTFL